MRVLPGGLQEKYTKELEGLSCQERLERVKSIQGALTNLFSTHPSVEERINILRSM